MLLVNESSYTETYAKLFSTADFAPLVPNSPQSSPRPTSGPHFTHLDPMDRATNQIGKCLVSELRVTRVWGAEVASLGGLMLTTHLP